MLLVSFVLVYGGHSWSAASADNLTPTPTSVTVATAPPTLPLDTPVPENTALPTVTGEQSTPITESTSIVQPTALPTVEVSTATPVASATALPLVTPIVPAPVVTAPPLSAPWPSAAQLRQDARLRWGRGIPASVRRWAFLIVPAAKQYHLDPNLIAAVMTMESNGDPLALSPADARGLMQILHGPWSPRRSVFEGAVMLADLYTQFGDWNLVLAAYNAGPGAVTSYGGVPPYRETRDYVIVVSYLWDLYGRHHLTTVRRAQYRKTLSDLRHFADQRKKVTRLAHLAHLAHVPDLALDTCTPRSCSIEINTPAPRHLDAFWPVASTPDPLQYVGPLTPQ